jgi:hypothetical protein
MVAVISRSSVGISMKLPVSKSIAVILLLLSTVAVYSWMESHTPPATIAFPPASSLPMDGSLVHQADNRETLLALPYTEFDQTKGSGWRPLYDERGQYREAAQLIDDYLARHPELKAWQRAALHYHAGQLFAGAGMNQHALAHWDQAQTPDLSPGWNVVVDASKAFLLHDRPALLAARARLPSGDDQVEVDTLIQHFGDSYADMRSWAVLCPLVALPFDATAGQRAAAEKLAKTFGLSLTQAQSKPNRCIWLEVRPWESSSGYPWDGYIILHYDSGTVIRASNQRWLDAAVERFIQSSRERNGKREIPTGLMSSFTFAQ